MLHLQLVKELFNTLWFVVGERLYSSGALRFGDIARCWPLQIGQPRASRHASRIAHLRLSTVQPPPDPPIPDCVSANNPHPLWRMSNSKYLQERAPYARAFECHYQSGAEHYARRFSDNAKVSWRADTLYLWVFRNSTWR